MNRYVRIDELQSLTVLQNLRSQHITKDDVVEREHPINWLLGISTWLLLLGVHAAFLISSMWSKEIHTSTTIYDTGRLEMTIENFVQQCTPEILSKGIRMLTKMHRLRWREYWATHLHSIRVTPQTCAHSVYNRKTDMSLIWMSF